MVRPQRARGALAPCRGAESSDVVRGRDFVHCPAKTEHIIIGAGDDPCAIFAVGAREPQAGADWGGYKVREVALRHGAGVERATTDPYEAYAHVPKREPTGYRGGWLPE